MSTDFDDVACSSVVAAVTKMIWNSDVPTTALADMPSRYSIAGTMMKPPPTPMMTVKIPTTAPSSSGASGEIYSPDL